MADAAVPPQPAFVELQLADSIREPTGLCRVELSDSSGRRMMVHLPVDSPTVLILAEAFWKRMR